MTPETLTPMAGVQVITSQLNDSNPEADHRMLAETVLVSGEGLASILNDIVDFAAGGIGPARVGVDRL